MKRIYFILVFLLLLSCNRSFIKKTATFSLMFEPGKTTNYTIKIDRTITVKEGDSIRNYRMKYSLNVAEIVSEVSSKFTTLNLKITKASGIVTHNGEAFATFVFDSLKGHVITVRLTLNGNIAELRGSEKIPTLMGTGAEVMSDYEVFSLLYDYLKIGSLKPLEIYKKESKIGRKVFRYEGIDRTKSRVGCAYITFKGTFDVKDAGYKGTYAYERTTKGSTSGYIYHLLDDGRLLEGMEKFNLKDTYIFPGFRKLNREVLVYTEAKVYRNFGVGGKENE